MPKTRVFISSGQRHSTGDEISEREIVQVRKMLENQIDFQVYVATQQHSIDGFIKNILENLEKSEHFLFIDFVREKIGSTENLHRGSLFSHQELAIAVYLKKPLSVFQDPGIENRNGILSFIQANPIPITDRSKLVENIRSNIKQEGWHNGWRNELEITRAAGEFQEILNHRGENRWAKFFHIDVNNRHDTKAAHDCSAYLQKIINLETGETIRPPQIELKWEGMKTESVTILPNDKRRFDAMYLEVPQYPLINFGVNEFLIDYPGLTTSYKLNAPGKYELVFEIISREFSPIKARFLLNYTYTANVNDISLTALNADEITEN